MGSLNLGDVEAWLEAYRRAVTGTQSGRASSSGRRRGRRHASGILMLRFAPDGRCAELREAWNWAEGTHQPHPGWGG